MYQGRGLCLPCLTVSQERMRRGCVSRRGRGIGHVPKHGKRTTILAMQASGRRKAGKKVMAQEQSVHVGWLRLLLCWGGGAV